MQSERAKRLLLKISPRLFYTLRAILQGIERIQRMPRAHKRARVIARVAATFTEKYGFVVQAGPFAGMSYVVQACGSELLPKLVGSYEAELQSVIAQALERSYGTMVNIGCAEGYYAVGLARCSSRAHVYAFDIDEASRSLCADMARVNRVSDRVSIEGACSLDRLRALALASPLIVMDCEGAEIDLLQPALVPDLAHCDVLVELHDFVNPAISSTILSRFAETHDVTVIDCVRRDPTKYHWLQYLNRADQQLTVDELRPKDMQWAFMRARSFATQADSVAIGLA